MDTQNPNMWVGHCNNMGRVSDVGEDRLQCGWCGLTAVGVVVVSYDALPTSGAPQRDTLTGSILIT